MTKKDASITGPNVGGDYDIEFKDRSFSIGHLQILDADGNLVSATEPDLSEADLKKLYSAMVLARSVDDRLLKLQRQGRVGTFPPCTGQEAGSCGPALAMSEKDWFVSSFRELGGRLMRGQPIESYLLSYGGYEEGNVFPGGERTPPMSIIVGAQTPHAVGIAYATKLRKEKNTAVVCFMGDGATSTGDFHEALNFAAVWQVPAVFICQNNQWAISLPRTKQSRAETLAQKAIAFGIPGIQVDGNDPLAMYQVTRDALDRAYNGKGPTFIEAVTYRLRMHTTADDPGRYQPDEQLEAWQRRDPLIRFRRYIEAKGIWDDEQQAALEADVKTKIEDAVKAFEERTGFAPDVPFDNIFGTKHPRIEEQRREFLENLKMEAGNE